MKWLRCSFSALLAEGTPLGSSGVPPPRLVVFFDPLFCSLDDLGRGYFRVDGAPFFVGPEGLERRELAIEKFGGHEVVATLCKSLRQSSSGDIEE